MSLLKKFFTAFCLQSRISFLLFLFVVLSDVRIVNGQDEKMPKWKKCNEVKTRITNAEVEIQRLERELYHINYELSNLRVEEEDEKEDEYRISYGRAHHDLAEAKSGKVPRYWQSQDVREEAAKKAGMAWDARWEKDIVAFLTALRNHYLEKVNEQKNRVDEVRGMSDKYQDLKRHKAVEKERINEDIKKYKTELETLDCKNVTKDNPDNKGDSNTVSGNYLDWIGTWVADNNRVKFTISGDRKTFSILFEYSYPGGYWNDAKGSGKLTNCKIDGNNNGTCDWHDKFETKDYTSSPVNGTMTLSLYGDAISVSIAVKDEARSVSWKGRNVL
jgi:hypothetical protein